jgi:hypothetical protein
MYSLPPQTVPVSVAPLDLAVDPDEPCRVYCLKCESYLDLHIPNPETPECMLGTCLDCGSWYLVDYTAGALALLPKLSKLMRRPAAPSSAPRKKPPKKNDGIWAA